MEPSHHDEAGMPVGPPVPDWSPRPPVGPVLLIGTHVRCEPLSAAHADLLYDPLVTNSPARSWTYMMAPAGMSREQFAAYLDGLRHAPASAALAIMSPDSAGLGVANLMRNDPGNGVVEVGGISYSAALQRTTAATEAMILMARHVFEDLGYRRYEWKCDSRNAPSVAAARRLGFRYEGRFRNALVYKGRNRDTDWFAMTDADWPAIAAAYDAWLDPANFDAAGGQRTPLAVPDPGPAPPPA